MPLYLLIVTHKVSVSSFEGLINSTQMRQYTLNWAVLQTNNCPNCTNGKLIPTPLNKQKLYCNSNFCNFVIAKQSVERLKEIKTKEDLTDHIKKINNFRRTNPRFDALYQAKKDAARQMKELAFA